MNPVARFFRALGWLFSLGFLKQAKKIEDKPEIFAMRYDEVIQGKAKAAQLIKNSLGGLIGQQESFKARLRDVTKEIMDLNTDKEGAEALMEERVKFLRSKGKGDEEILKDSEFVQLQAAYNDAASTIEAKNLNVTDLETTINNLQEQIDNVTIQGQDLKREVERIKSEKHEAVASVTASKELDKVNEALAGISTTGTDNELAELREMRRTADGRAKASARLAGTDVSIQRDKLRKAAQGRVANKELLGKLGLKVSTPAALEQLTEAKPAAKLPE
jgi:hypothetical protein